MKETTKGKKPACVALFQKSKFTFRRRRRDIWQNVLLGWIGLQSDKKSDTRTNEMNEQLVLAIKNPTTRSSYTSMHTHTYSNPAEVVLQKTAVEIHVTFCPPACLLFSYVRTCSRLSFEYIFGKANCRERRRTETTER